MRPLEGLLVVSLEHAASGPLASRHLGDLGARVIKIERPGVGDFARGYDRAVHGQSTTFVWLNRGKESLTLDLKSPSAKEVLLRLIARADVLIQNLAPGAARRLGLSYEVLAPLHPRLILCDISGYGESGPYAEKKAYDLLIQAESGVIDITGTPEAPARVGISVADIATGMYAFSASLAALLRRERGGGGASVKVAMLEALSEWMSIALLKEAYGGAAPAREGMTHPQVAPYGPHRTADGFVIFGVQNEREWQSFCAKVLREPDLAEDPRFFSNTARIENRAALTEEIEKALSRLGTARVLALLDAAGIANGRLNSVHEVSHHPQLCARQRWRMVETPGGPVRALLPPFEIDAAPAPMARVPALGEHTHAILGELGYDAKAIAALEAEGAV